MDLFSTHCAVGEDKAGLDIFGFQKRVLLQYRFGCVASCQHAKDVFHGNAQPPDDWLSTEYLRIYLNTLK